MTEHMQPAEIDTLPSAPSAPDLRHPDLGRIAGLSEACPRERSLSMFERMAYARHFDLRAGKAQDDKDLETLFLMASEEFSYLTSSMVKEVASVGGPLHDFLHPEVADRLKTQLRMRQS